MSPAPVPAECPHGDPRPERCALCRLARRRAERLAAAAARYADAPDPARRAAGDPPEEDA